VDERYRNIYEIAWRRRQDDYVATSVSFALLDERSGYRLGTGYIARQGRLADDGYWFAQVGLGMNSEEDYHGDLYIELVKPLSRSTLLRVRNEVFGSTGELIYDTFRLNLIQALSQRLALNVGYRIFAESQPAADADDLLSHEGSVAFVLQAWDNVFLAAKYRYYWNSVVRSVNSVSLESRWNLNQRLSLVGGYQLQHFDKGLIGHGFRAGVSLSF